MMSHSAQLRRSSSHSRGRHPPPSLRTRPGDGMARLTSATWQMTRCRDGADEDREGGDGGGEPERNGRDGDADEGDVQVLPMMWGLLLECHDSWGSTRRPSKRGDTAIVWIPNRKYLRDCCSCTNPAVSTSPYPLPITEIVRLLTEYCPCSFSRSSIRSAQGREQYE